jgi:hypothetical protein
MKKEVGWAQKLWWKTHKLHITRHTVGMKERGQKVHFRHMSVGFYRIALRITGFLDISYSEQKTVFQNQQVCLYSS